MDLVGDREKDAGSLVGIWPVRVVVGSGYRESVGICGGDGGDGGWETMRNGRREMERGRGSGRDEDDDERGRYGEDEGGNENRGRSRNSQSGRGENYRWRLGCSGQNQQEEQKSRRKREQSELSSFVSPSPSGSEAGLKFAYMWDKEKSPGFLLPLGRRFCRVLDSAKGRLKSDPTPRRNSDSKSDSVSDSVSDVYRPIPLPEPTSQPGNGSISPLLNLRGGAGSKRLDDDERVPKVIWYLAGGVGRAPTGKGLREWKEKARKKDRGRTKEKVGFWGKIGLGMIKKGKTRKQKIAKERKGSAGGGADGAQAAGGGVVRGDTWGDAGNVVPGGPKDEGGAAPGTGEGGPRGEGSGHGGAVSSGRGRGSGSGSGSGSSSSGSGNSGRTE